MNITADEKGKVESQLKKYYTKLDMEPPFDKSNGIDITVNPEEPNVIASISNTMDK